MHAQFPAILLTVVLSWILVTLWTRVLDGAAEAVGLRPDRLPDAALIAVAATAALLTALARLGRAGGALADSVAGMELSALRSPNPAVAPELLAGLAAAQLRAVARRRQTTRARSRSRSRGPSEPR